MEEFRSKDTISRVEMHMALARITMGKKENPKKLKALSNRYDTDTKKIDEDDFVAAILTQAPDQYASALGLEQRNASKANHDLTVKELIDTMSDQWRITAGAAEEGKKEHDSEIQLGAVFSGKCYNCGQSGHRKTDCRSLRRGGNKGGNHNNNNHTPC